MVVKIYTCLIPTSSSNSSSMVRSKQKIKLKSWGNLYATLDNFYSNHFSWLGQHSGPIREPAKWTNQQIPKCWGEKEAKKLKYEVSINKWTGFPIHSWVSDLGLGTTNQRTNVTGFGLWWSTTLTPTLRLCGYTFFSCFFSGTTDGRWFSDGVSLPFFVIC